MMRTIQDVAFDIAAEWKKPYFGAKPYLEAMMSLYSLDDRYGHDGAKQIVNYFLANAATFKGERAKQLKSELKQLLKGS